jgi:hypothetical protein
MSFNPLSKICCKYEPLRAEDGEITAQVIFNLFKGQMDTKRAAYGWISKNLSIESVHYPSSKMQ